MLEPQILHQKSADFYAVSGLKVLMLFVALLKYKNFWLFSPTRNMELLVQSLNILDPQILIIRQKSFSSIFQGKIAPDLILLYAYAHKVIAYVNETTSYNYV